MAGRGRGRGAPGVPGQVKGATWAFDPTLKLDSAPSELFPPHPNLRRPAPLTDREIRQIIETRNLTKKIHRGPLYTKSTKRDLSGSVKTFSEDQVNAQFGGNVKADMDPFTGVETYSMRFLLKKNELPKLSDCPFHKSLFPEDLWPTLEGTEGLEARKRLDRIQKKKAALASGSGAVAGDKLNRLNDRIDKATEGIDDDEEPDEEDEDAMVDSEFDDEDGGDYDAEQYFDGGDGGDDDDDGGGRGDDY
ncbi:hypothetical protein LZ554_005820 [Drepanopeziza brunnea f. sp. 'monogermtubi']|nr:hypothetical protein LZ554_005820 [Drepanopeziza brunnea f. sp. 'monogermtubi']